MKRAAFRSLHNGFCWPCLPNSPTMAGDGEYLSSVAELRTSMRCWGLFKNMKVAAENGSLCRTTDLPKISLSAQAPAVQSCSELLSALGFTGRVELFWNCSPQLSAWIFDPQLFWKLSCGHSARGHPMNQRQIWNKIVWVWFWVVSFPTLPFVELHKDTQHLVVLWGIAETCALGVFWELVKQSIHRVPVIKQKLAWQGNSVT